MIDFLIALSLDIVRMIIFIGAMVYGSYNFLMLFSTAANYSRSCERCDDLNIQQETPNSIKTSCNIAFYTLLCGVGFNIAYLLYYNHPSTVMYYFHLQGAQ